MLQPPSPRDARRLHDFLTAENYTAQGLRAALDMASPPLPQQRNMPRLLELTREPNSLNVLARWFFGVVPVALATARAVTPEWFLRLCLDCGILRQEAANLVSTVALAPCGTLLVASDPFHHLCSDEAFGHVLAVNPAARHLLNFTRRLPVRSTLDLGAGCGIQALVAATHSQAVVATDLNPRAAAYCLFNARLNGVGNVECLTGDLFAPVRGRRFDLIVCNPPFVLAPSNELLYRDNDMPLDQLCRRLVREAPDHLEEGGFFQMIFEWVQLKGETWQDRVGEWFENTGCDALVLKQLDRDPSQYALTRLQETPPGPAEADAATYARWMGHYRTTGVERIHAGLVAMRRRTGANWVALEETGGGQDEPFAAAVLQRFANRDFLEGGGADARLLAAKPRLSPQVRLTQDYRCVDGHWRTLSIRLQAAQNPSRPIALEGDVAQFLARLDGEHVLGELIGSLAAEAQVDPARVRQECLGTLRYFLERGLVLV